MEGSLKDLSQYRFSCAKENLEAAKVLLQAGQFKSSVNRSYYAVFHGLRAVTALDKFDSSKHSGVIAYFNHTYVKEGIFDKSISKLVDTCYRLREKADYQDFVHSIERNGPGAIRKSGKDFTDVRTIFKSKVGNTLEF